MKDAKKALSLGKLDELLQEDHDYLLECFRKRYGEHLKQIGSGKKVDEYNKLLLEYTALDQLFGGNDLSKEILNLWERQSIVKPRALS